MPMSAKKRQLLQIQQGGRAVLYRKMMRALQILPKLPLYILTVPVLLVLRLIRPWLLVRSGGLISTRIGHFAANTEMYLCEQDADINVPKQRYIDLFFMGRPICNCQLAKMWKRTLTVWPSSILAKIYRVNHIIPGGSIHEIGSNTQVDRDVHNLLDKQEPHLFFTKEEEIRGKETLRQMGITPQDKFVYLIVRDSLYISNEYPGSSWDSGYHSYRDSNIDNYQLAVETLAELGYFVFRMGKHVKNTLRSNHPKVIDYATNGMRSDFMDIYLGAKCEFCISTGLGLDTVPAWGFRRPTIFTNLLPTGYLPTFSDKFILTTKRHILSGQQRELTLSEIFSHRVGFCMRTSNYETKGIDLIENTPEEIRDVVMEMVDRLNGNWLAHEDDEVLQQRFWEIFPTDGVDAHQGNPLHGEIRAHFGANFLRNNREWLR